VSGAPIDVLDSGAAGGAAIRGSGLRLGATGVTVVLTLISVPLLARHLGVVGFGRYVLAMSLATLFAGLLEGGLGMIAQREYAVLEGARRTELWRDALGLRLALTAAAVALSVTFGAVAGYDGELLLAVLVAGVGQVLLYAQALLTVPLVGRLMYGGLAAIEVGRTALLVALTLVLIQLDAGVVDFLLLVAFTSLLAYLATSLLVRRQETVRPAFDTARWWALLKRTLPLVVATAMFAAYFRVSIVLLDLIASDRETGYFAVSARVVEVVLQVPVMLLGGLLPVLARAARDDPVRFRFSTERTFDMSLIIGFLFAVALGTGAHLIVDVVAGPKSAPSIGVLQIHGLAVAANFAAVALCTFLLALGELRALVVASSLAMGSTIVATLVFASLWGAKGAAAAYVLTDVALAVAAWVILARRRETIGLAVAPWVLAATGLAWLTQLLDVTPLAHAVIGPLVYVGFLLTTGRVPRELFQALRGG
jgi:O-antigen/teichoic acid export membrane protein